MCCLGGSHNRACSPLIDPPADIHVYDMQPTQPVAHLHPPHTTCVCVCVCVPLPPAVVRQVYGEYGVGGFWNGAAASLVMVVNPTLQYALYEWLLQARSKLRCGQPVGRGVRGRGWGVTAAAAGQGLVAVRCCTQQGHVSPCCLPLCAGCCLLLLLLVGRPRLLHTPRPSWRVCRRGSGGKQQVQQRATALEVFLLSALAKAGATLVTYPMMNIKTRMMTASRPGGGSNGGSGGGAIASSSSSGGGGQHSSILRAATEIARTEGAWRCWTGDGHTCRSCLQITPAAAGLQSMSPLPVNICSACLCLATAASSACRTVGLLPRPAHQDCAERGGGGAAVCVQGEDHGADTRHAGGSCTRRRCRQRRHDRTCADANGAQGRVVRPDLCPLPGALVVLAPLPLAMPSLCLQLVYDSLQEHK